MEWKKKSAELQETELYTPSLLLSIVLPATGIYNRNIALLFLLFNRLRAFAIGEGDGESARWQTTGTRQQYVQRH